MLELDRIVLLEQIYSTTQKHCLDKLLVENKFNIKSEFVFLQKHIHLLFYWLSSYNLISAGLKKSVFKLVLSFLNKAKN